jgi:hypothetical protein
MDTGRLFEQAAAMGRRNQEVIELARRHCTHMQFPEWELGGRGMAEAATGLPINTRRVHCAYAAPSHSASANLEWIAGDFYKSNCVGCPNRLPTGEVPNLATVIEAHEAEQARLAEQEQRRLTERRSAWRARADRRRVLRAMADPAMQGALADVDVLDADPSQPADSEASEAAVQRLVALAERAPDTYSTDVVEHLAQVADQAFVVTLLSPLRRIAGGGTAFRSRVLNVAISVLRRAAVVEAGRCLVDLADVLDSHALDERVVHSLLLLAGQPEQDELGHRIRSASSEPAPLRLAADRRPAAVETAIRKLLRRRRSAPDLVLPPGLGPDQMEPPSDLERCVGAGAVRSLASTHTELALRVAEDLALNLADDDEDRYDLHAVDDVQRTLAVLLVLRPGEVATLLHRTGEYASREHRERLFGVLERTWRVIDPSYRWREPSDPILDPPELRSVGKLLLTMALEWVGGTWGEDVANQAADLIDNLTSDSVVGTAEDVPAVLGALLTTIDRLDRVPSGRLLVPDDAPPQLRAMEAGSRRMTIAGTAHRLTKALVNLASIDCLGTVRAIRDVLQSERASQREVELAWRVLPILGEIGAKHGGHEGLLRTILPILHTYLVHSEAVLRGAAIDAWSTIASRHPTPSSLNDLLPVLLQDPHIPVIRSLLKATVRLEWNEQELRSLLIYAWTVASKCPASEKETLQLGLRALRVLAGTHRHRVELLILKRADDLDAYELRDMLRGDWLRESRVSSMMAKLRLKLAQDPRVSDRLNSGGDDEELRALLECGAGLRDLPEEDVRAGALRWCPQHPHWTVEFVEVLWRAARVENAASLIEAALAATPTERVYESRRAMLACVGAAVRLDALAVHSSDTERALELASEGLAEALHGCHSEERPSELAKEVADRILLRCLLLDSEQPASLTELLPNGVPSSEGAVEDPAAKLRDRAAQLAELRTRLEASARRETATAHYVRGIASLCAVAHQLLRFDAAELDASDSQAAHLTAAKRRAGAAVRTLINHFGGDDPIGAPLVQALEEVQTISTGTEVAPILAKWASLPIPLLFISAPTEARARRRRKPSAEHEPERTAPPPVGVVLAYIDNRLVTGPQVLRPGTAYALRLEVRTGTWPDWADRLDAEFLSHLNTTEAQTPSFSWRRSDLSDGSVVGEGTLVLRFGLAAGQPAPPFLLSLRLRGEDKGGQRQERCDIAGHRELRLRPFDASRDHLTGYRVVDERLLTLYERLHGAGYDEDHVQAFCRLLTAVCRAGLSMTWEKRYMRGQRVRERDFHDDLHERLLNDPELGGRVERNEPLALGYLDVRHDGITAELKVEKRVAVTKERAAKYMGQPTQYAAANGARLSILCILDMSSKATPVGTPENYLWQIEPALHGLTNPEAPSLVTVVVVNGNLPTPSSWSRGRPGDHRTIP